MEKNKREFVIDELMVSGFMEREKDRIILEEAEESGKSALSVELGSVENLVIRNVDQKRTDLQFFQRGKEKSLYKRVDHIIYEQIAEDKWKLHLIEMKSWVGVDKWKEIKGKFRASYLLAQGIAAMLEMKLFETSLYTTYERVDLKPPLHLPAGRRLMLGEHHARPEEEWNGACGLNFGETVFFAHKPVCMKRNEQTVLEGELSIR